MSHKSGSPCSVRRFSFRDSSPVFKNSTFNSLTGVKNVIPAKFNQVGNVSIVSVSLNKTEIRQRRKISRSGGSRNTSFMSARNTQ